MCSYYTGSWGLQLVDQHTLGIQRVDSIACVDLSTHSSQITFSQPNIVYTSFNSVSMHRFSINFIRLIRTCITRNIISRNFMIAAIIVSLTDITLHTVIISTILSSAHMPSVVTTPTQISDAQENPFIIVIILMGVVIAIISVVAVTVIVIIFIKLRQSMTMKG